MPVHPAAALVPQFPLLAANDDVPETPLPPPSVVALDALVAAERESDEKKLERDVVAAQHNELISELAPVLEANKPGKAMDEAQKRLAESEMVLAAHERSVRDARRVVQDAKRAIDSEKWVAFSRLTSEALLLQTASYSTCA